jgi:Tol biopolymer transport system component
MTVPIGGGPPIVSSRPPEMDREIAQAGLSLERFVWSRSSRAIFFEGTSERVRNLWRITVDPATLAWIGGPDRLTTGAGQEGDVAVSPEGTRLVFSTRVSTTRLWAFPFDSVSGRVLGDAKPVTSGGGEEQDADAPLDGSKLIYSATRAGRQELWERSVADGREHLLLSTATWSLTRPRWSPDGLRVAYTRRRPGVPMDRAEPAVALLGIGGEERLLTKPGDVNLVPSDWSRDGRQLLGMCAIGTPSHVAACVLPVSDGPQTSAELRIVASDAAKNIFEGRFSPDQQWITFIAVNVADTGVSRVFVVPASGGEWRPVTEGRWYDDKPHWAPDGKTLYFTSDRYGALNVWARRFDPSAGQPAGEPFAVTSFTTPRQTLSPNSSRTQIAVTRTHLFVPITETAGEIWTLEGVDR